MNSLIDFLGYTLLRAITVLLTHLPVGFTIWLGRVLGVIGYYLDFSHRSIAYDNLKTAFAGEKSPQELKCIIKRLYQNFSQNIGELLRLPAVDIAYLKKYISIEGEEYLREVLQQGKGLVFLAVHFGSWEVSNILGVMFGYHYMMIAKEQKRYQRLDKLLNSYRQISGAYVVKRGWGTRDIIESLKRKEVVGMVADQGGKGGIFVEFFGKEASMSAGALRIAIRLDVPVLPVFLIRQNGPYHVLRIKPALDLKSIQDEEENVLSNLRKTIAYAEEVIREYPEQYAWFYKVWKYSKERKIVILSDGKAGHLRQSEAVAEALSGRLKNKNIISTVQTVQVNFKSNLSKTGLAVSSLFSKKRLCHGCLQCLKYFLDKDSLESVCRVKPDFVISCGSALAGLNLILSHESRAKSIAVLKPGLLGVNKFDAVIMPKHDNPPLRKNVFVTLGSPNLVDNEYLENKKSNLLQELPQIQSPRIKMGVMIGGDTKKDIFDAEAMKSFLDWLKETAESLDLELLVTTSRRTPRELEGLVKQKLGEFSRCKLLIIANEKNIPEAVGGILALSQVLLVSADSISMISEAASSGKNVLAFRFTDRPLNSLDRHDRFLKALNEEGHIILTSILELPQKVEALVKRERSTKLLNDRAVIIKAVNSVS